MRIILLLCLVGVLLAGYASAQDAFCPAAPAATPKTKRDINSLFGAVMNTAGNLAAGAANLVGNGLGAIFGGGWSVIVPASLNKAAIRAACGQNFDASKENLAGKLGAAAGAIVGSAWSAVVPKSVNEGSIKAAQVGGQVKGTDDQGCIKTDKDVFPIDITDTIRMDYTSEDERTAALQAVLSVYYNLAGYKNILVAINVYHVSSKQSCNSPCYIDETYRIVGSTSSATDNAAMLKQFQDFLAANPTPRIYPMTKACTTPTPVAAAGATGAGTTAAGGGDMKSLADTQSQMQKQLTDLTNTLQQVKQSLDQLNGGKGATPVATPAQPAASQAQPAAAQPAAVQPAAVQPAAVQPAAAQPAAAKPAAVQPAAAKPAAAQPATPAVAAALSPQQIQQLLDQLKAVQDQLKAAQSQPAAKPVAPKQSVQPTPAQPTPAQPTPAQPTPAQPTPAQPTPAQPTPAQPTPAVTPATQPATVQPASNSVPVAPNGPSNGPSSTNNNAATSSPQATVSHGTDIVFYASANVRNRYRVTASFVVQNSQSDSDVFAALAQIKQVWSQTLKSYGPNNLKISQTGDSSFYGLRQIQYQLTFNVAKAIPDYNKVSDAFMKLAAAAGVYSGQVNNS